MRYRAVYAIVAAGAATQTMVQGVTIPLLPEIQQRMGTDQSTASWVLTTYLLCASVATPIGGRIGDAYGKTRVWVISLCLLALGSVLAGVATSIGQLIGARAVQGFGCAVIPLSFAVIRDHLPEDKVRNATAFISALLSVGFAASIVVTGPIVEAFGYVWVFMLPALAATLVAIATILFVPESATVSKASVPLLPALLLSGWLVALLLGVNRGPALGWTDPRILGLLAVAVGLFVVWLVVESRIPVPLIDLKLMSQRAVWSTNLVALAIGVAMYSSVAILPAFYETPSSNGYGFGATITQVGQIMLPSSIVSFVFGASAARLANRFGVRRTLVVGSLLSTLALVWSVVAHDHVWQLVLASCVSGIGTGVVFANLANAVLDAVPSGQAGTAIGMNANLRILGGAVGTAITVTIITADTRPNGHPDEQGYVWGFRLPGGDVACRRPDRDTDPGIQPRSRQ